MPHLPVPRLAPLLIGIALLIGCRADGAGARRDPLRRRAPLEIGPVVPLAMPVLAEVSGTVGDPSRPGRAWMINDGGHPAELIAVNARGEVDQQVAVQGARNIDWEELTLGPCGAATCLYLADVGDNDARRRFVTVYRMPIPAETARTVEAARLDLQWPDGPDDVEAAMVDDRGALWFITKGRSGNVQHLLEVPADAWDRSSCASTIATPCRQGPVIATRRQTLTLPVSGTQDWITGAALSPDGRVLALRTYADLLLLPRSADGLVSESGGIRCDLGEAQRQGEAVAWLADGRLLLTTESGTFTPASQRLVRCPLPAGR